MRKTKKDKKMKNRFTINKLINMAVIIPLVISSLILGLLIISLANSRIKKQVHNALVSTINQVGTAFDYSTGYDESENFAEEVAVRLSDVSKLGYQTAYVYFVDKNGTMLSHPNKEKIGQPVENAAVKQILTRLGKGEELEPDVITYEYKGLNKYAAYYVGANKNYVAVLTADESEALAAVSSMKNTTFVVVIVSIIIFAVMSVIFARMISKPLVMVAKDIETLSTGDISVSCNAKSSVSETVSIINSVNILRDALQSSIGNVKESASVLNNAIVSVDEMTSNNVESINQINDAISEVASTSQTVAENAQNMAEKSIGLESRVEELNENVSVLYDASQSIKAVNEEASQCMASVYDGSKKSVEAVHAITTKITETNKAIEDVSKAVTAIESIAAQTNLLSLNASIEAARAGEAGRGFAVVADEIRNLADSSAQSAKEIKEIIENVMALSIDTVNISNQVYNVISEAQKEIETTQKKFIELLESVEVSLNEINKIKNTAGSLDEIKADMAMIISELSAISQEVGASSQEVAAACQRVAGACTDTQASTQEMKTINENVSTAIEFFEL